MADIDQDFYPLLQQIKEGSEEAARRFLERYGPYLLGVIRRRLPAKLRSKFDSQDFLQDAYASFFRMRPDPEVFANQQAFLRFLAKLAHHKVTEALHQRLGGKHYSLNQEHSLDGSAKLQAQDLPASDPTGSAVMAAREKWQELVTGSLPSHEQMLEMIVHGHKHKEIAALYGLTVRQVRRVLENLRVRYEP